MIWPRGGSNVGAGFSISSAITPHEAIAPTLLIHGCLDCARFRRLRLAAGSRAPISGLSLLRLLGAACAPLRLARYRFSREKAIDRRH
jgi:hypothetical protein